MFFCHRRTLVLVLVALREILTISGIVKTDLPYQDFFRFMGEEIPTTAT